MEAWKKKKKKKKNSSYMPKENQIFSNRHTTYSKSATLSLFKLSTTIDCIHIVKTDNMALVL